MAQQQEALKLVQQAKEVAREHLQVGSCGETSLKGTIIHLSMM